MSAALDRFEEIVLPYLGAAYNLARWLTGNSDDAQDVVQESYLRALKSFHTFRPGAEGRAWLLKIVRNTCFSWLRRNRSVHSAILNDDERHDPAAISPDPEAALIEQADVELVRRALEDLRVEYREVILLRELEGFSYREIADILSLPLGTVMSRLSRGRKELEARLRGAVQELER
jgi:RNA polymerase sigma-70 factor, ECF subfamily